MKNFYLLCSIVISSITFGQTTLEDFDGSPNVGGFEGITTAEVVADPTDASNMVAKLEVADGAGQPWQGANVFMVSNYIQVTDPATQTVTIDVWADAPFSFFAKIDQGVNGAPASAADADHTGSGWETLTFTFNEAIDGTGAANGEYAVIAVFPNWNGSGFNNPPVARTVYIDNIMGTAGASIGGGTVAEPMDPAPTPTFDEAADQVLSIFSDAYTDLADTNFNPNWGQATTVEELDIDGNATLAYTNLNYQGTNLGSLDGGVAQDVSSKEFFHLDYWTPNASIIQFYILDLDGSSEVFYDISPIAFEEWVSVDIPMSHFSDNGEDLTQIHQFKVVGDGNVYFDNWFFYTPDNMSVEDINGGQSDISFYPNPARNGESITFTENVRAVEIYNANGMLAQKADSNTVTLTVPAGVYIMRITDENGVVSNEKLIVR